MDKYIIFAVYRDGFHFSQHVNFDKLINYLYDYFRDNCSSQRFRLEYYVKHETLMPFRGERSLIKFMNESNLDFIIKLAIKCGTVTIDDEILEYAIAAIVKNPQIIWE